MKTGQNIPYESTTILCRYKDKQTKSKRKSWSSGRNREVALNVISQSVEEIGYEKKRTLKKKSGAEGFVRRNKSFYLKLSDRRNPLYFAEKLGAHVLPFWETAHVPLP